MSNVRFLIFRGSLQNEGNFWALESDETILLIGAGKDNPYVIRNILSLDYLKENKDKIKAVLINNSSPKNSGFLQEIYNELDLNVPIYGSRSTKLALDVYFNFDKKIVNNFIEVESLSKDLIVNDFSISF